MDNMEIDSVPEPNHLRPRDRVLRRLAQVGVPAEKLEMFQGFVQFVSENRSRIPELVSAILPPDEEVGEALQETKVPGRKALNPSLKNRFRECMLWIKWMMFMGDPTEALKNLSTMCEGRGVCGAVWGSNDIAYRCRTCELDPTCAICVSCFRNGDHRDHDYSVIYTGGGCCDCGDATAWKREGFCSKHKGAEQIQPLPAEFANSVEPVLDALFSCWKNKLVSAETAIGRSPRAPDRVNLCKKVANEITFVVVEMLLEFCRCSESLLSFVSMRVISSVGLLEIMVKAERFLVEGVAKKLHELLLKLLGEPIFKYEFAKVFLTYYPFVVREVINDSTDGSLKKYPLLPTFSVQIFTVPTLTPRLVKEMNLLVMLLECLGCIFLHCAGEDCHLQLTRLGNLYEITIRVVEDIRFVISHSVVLKYVTHDQRDILRTWIKLLSSMQGMCPMKRETGLHIEEESEHINVPFVLCHSCANIHALLVEGAFYVHDESDDNIFANTGKQEMDERERIRQTKVGLVLQESFKLQSASSISVSDSQLLEVKSDSDSHLLIPPPVVWLVSECLRAIECSLGANNKSGGLSSQHSGSISNNNFEALKKTLSKMSKGKFIFGGLSGHHDDHDKQSSMPECSNFLSLDADIAKSKGQDGEIDSAGFNDCLMEGDSCKESDALLSLTDWPDIIYDVSSQDVSVHIPLHRFLALLLQKALTKCFGDNAVGNLIGASTSTTSSSVYGDFFRFVLSNCHPHGFSAFVMEHPLRNRVFCAQVRVGMWRKNGDAAIIAHEWYRSVRWSEQGLELDLFLLQCCAALAPPDLYISRIVERFGLSGYLSLHTEQSSEYEPVLMHEMLLLIIQILQERRFSGLTTTENLRRELVHKLAIGDATRSQLVKSLPRDLSKTDQLQDVLDTVATYSNPSGFNQGMYSLRWTYWKELDLYHPRWNSRDLQAAEERYMRYCSASAWTTQLPKWTKIYPPLSGVARVGTCKVVCQIIRAVLFYAVYTDKFTDMRAPDGVLLSALHLLSLALDICFQQRELGDTTSHTMDSAPILAFAGEEYNDGLCYGAGEQSLLSLLVSLMRIHKRENSNVLETGSCNVSSLIDSLLKKFAEIDSGCLARLQQLAPEVVVLISQAVPGVDAITSALASDSERRKAKARERQAAIMAKMKAEQSKFLSSVNSTADDNLEDSESENMQDMVDSAQDVCSLCHDPNSKVPVSFLILLQKSKLLSFVDRGPPSWDQVRPTNMDQAPVISNQVPGQSGVSSAGISRENASTHFARLVQNAVSEFADHAQPGEVNAILEFVKAQFPSLRNNRVPRASEDRNDRTEYTLDMLEQDMYFSIRKEMHDNVLCPGQNERLSASEDVPNSRKGAESVLLGKYIAALSREHPSASENAHSEKEVQVSTSEHSTYNAFGPADCDGVHLSSCGHAVHQGCLSLYLSSLRERYSRRISFEGGHIVDPDEGEFLCPVCRRLGNSVLPSLPGDFQKVWKQPLSPTVNASHAAEPLATSSEGKSSLEIQQALSLLKTASNMVERGDFLKDLPLQRNETRPILDLFSKVLLKLYFPKKSDKLSGSARVNHSMIMWDTLKYSLVSMEIAARCGRTHLAPNYGLQALYKELKSSSGFTLSLLLKIVLSARNKNSLHVLQRFRGLQLYAESICLGVSLDHANSTCGNGGDMSSILNYIGKEVSYPDTQFWNQAANPVLAHDAFSSLMWVLFCLPCPFLSCEESLLALVHIFYSVSVAQAIVMYCGKRPFKIGKYGLDDSLITDLSKLVGQSEWISQYFVSNYIDSSSDIMDVIHEATFPYLRRCALLWKLLSTSVTAPFSDRDHLLNAPSHASNDIMDIDGYLAEISEVQELEKMFHIPPLDAVLKDQTLRSLAVKWFHHISKEHESHSFGFVLNVTPVVPFKLMDLPHVYQDLLQRYIKQRCSNCKSVIEEPALCLLCGRICSPNWKSCCSDSACQSHAMTCGAGIGVFLLIKRTTILLQRCARQAPWPSPYLDAFGEEDVDMHRGKPLYLNEERYGALTSMVAAHGLDRSSKVLGQTTTGAFFLVVKNFQSLVVEESELVLAQSFAKRHQIVISYGWSQLVTTLGVGCMLYLDKRFTWGKVRDAMMLLSALSLVWEVKALQIVWTMLYALQEWERLYQALLFV
ncbi:hypothetical protein Tsubulata_014891 [Turnera subulata]|uniref:E3 ubiquitin-protein ligase n=1 Tax=Turnera subulata TaxID=218843 RepID=A0A9Q0JIS5_9ROSI|nr:hypothetical protein Tsubulata_014891 [Turnera subulata]